VALVPVPPPVEQVVPFDVAFVGFIPACAPAFWVALPPPLACVEAESFFTCPGAFAEFPCPLSARAEPVNAAMPEASTNMLVRLAMRFVISFSPVFRMTLQRGVAGKQRTNGPYGYGLQGIFPWN